MKNKKILLRVIAVSLLATVGTVFATPNWDITGTWTILFTCTYGCPEGAWEHLMVVTLEDLGTGEFEGYGYYTGGTYEWEITSGVVDGDDIEFTANYTAGTSCTMNVEGTIASDGSSMSGEWSDDCWGSDRGGTWTATGTACKLNTYYQDSDGDGYGNPEVSVLACEQPEGYVENSDDCNDEDSEINPDAEEVCDTVDNNCDGEVDTHSCNWYCAKTEEDTWKIDGKYIGTAGYLGVNRLMWVDDYNWDDYFTTLSSKTVKGKTTFQKVPSEFTLEQTNGCSCSQILEILHEYNPEVYGDMEGHWKFGCSKSVVEEFIRLISPVTKVNMCEKDPENDWQCKDEGATGVFYNFENQLGPKYIDAEGLTPGNWYRVELVNKGEYCTLWEPLNSGPAYDNRVMFYAQADSEGKLHMEFTLDITGYYYVEPNVKNADWVPKYDYAPYGAPSEWIYTGQGWDFVLYGMTTTPLECEWTP